MSNFSLLWGPALQWQIQFKLSQNTCIRISPGRGAGSTSDVGQTLFLGTLPCFSVIALLSRIGVGKRWGLGAIRSDSFRWIETFSLTRKCDKEQSLGTGSGTESITFAIILYLLVYFDSMWFVFRKSKKHIFLAWEARDLVFGVDKGGWWWRGYGDMEYVRRILMSTFLNSANVSQFHNSMSMVQETC